MFKGGKSMDLGVVLQGLFGGMVELEEEIQKDPDAINKHLEAGIDHYLTQRLYQWEFDVCLLDLIKYVTQHPSVQVHFNYHKSFFPTDEICRRIKNIMEKSPYWRPVVVTHEASPEHTHFKCFGVGSQGGYVAGHNFKYSILRF